MGLAHGSDDVLFLNFLQHTQHAFVAMLLAHPTAKSKKLACTNYIVTYRHAVVAACYSI